MTAPVTGVSPAPLPYRGGGGVNVLGVVAPVVVPVVETIPPAELQNSEKRAIFSVNVSILERCTECEQVDTSEELHSCNRCNTESVNNQEGERLLSLQFIDKQMLIYITYFSSRKGKNERICNSYNLTPISKKVYRL